MTDRGRGRGFAARPRDADAWIRTAEPVPPIEPVRSAGFTARLTVDVTPDLRGRIKVTAFQRGVTVADMLRDLLAREFPDIEGEPR